MVLQTFVPQQESVDAPASKMTSYKDIKPASSLDGGSHNATGLLTWYGSTEPSWSWATSPTLPHTMTPVGPRVIQSSGLAPCAGSTGLSGG